MKIKTLFFILIILSFSFFSCDKKTEKKAAVLSFNNTSDVPVNIPQTARNIVNDRITKIKHINNISLITINEKTSNFPVTASNYNGLARMLGVDLIIVGNIETTVKNDLIDKFIDAVKGNKAWYKLNVSCYDLNQDKIVSSFSGVYDEKLYRFESDVYKLNLHKK